jgi:hypothetical protein
VADSAAFAGDFRRNNGEGYSGPAAKAIWLFSDAGPGVYEVFVTYLPGSAASSDAPYRVYSDGQLMTEVRVDQQTPPAGELYQGSVWESLGTVSISQTGLSVELHDDTQGKVIADAVRLVPIMNDVQIVSVNKSLDQEVVSAVVTVTQP